MTTERHEDLLALLATALTPAGVAPEPRQIDVLHQLVAHQASQFSVGRQPRRPKRPLAPIAAAVAVVAAVTGLATSGPALPRPVRVVASAAGLPVESPALIDARHALDQLQDALVRRDAAHVAADAADLQRRMAALSPEDRRELGAGAPAALASAAELAHGTPNATQTALTPPTPPSAPPSASARGIVGSTPPSGTSSPFGPTHPPNPKDGRPAAGAAGGAVGDNATPSPTTTIQPGQAGHDGGHDGCSGGSSTTSSEGGGCSPG
jgi:hypothetical protein